MFRTTLQDTWWLSTRKTGKNLAQEAAEWTRHSQTVAKLIANGVLVTAFRAEFASGAPRRMGSRYRQHLWRRYTTAGPAKGSRHLGAARAVPDGAPAPDHRLVRTEIVLM